MILRLRLIITILVSIISLPIIAEAQNKHQLGFGVNNSIIHGKKYGFFATGLHGKHLWTLHPRIQWRNDLGIGQAFRIGYNPIVYPDLDILLNYVVYEPRTQTNFLANSSIQGLLFNKTDWQMGVGFGLSGRAMIDRKTYYREQLVTLTNGDTIGRGITYEKATEGSLSWGCQTNVFAQRRISDKLVLCTEAGWRGYLSDIQRKDYQNRSQGISVFYCSVSLMFSKR